METAGTAETRLQVNEREGEREREEEEEGDVSIRKRVTKRSRWSSREETTEESAQTVLQPEREKRSEWEEEEEEEEERERGRVREKSVRRRNRWDETPLDVTTTTSGAGAAASTDETPRARSRWDETPQVASGGTSFNASMETPVSGSFGSMETPVGASGLETPVHPHASTSSAAQQLHPSLMTPEHLSAMRWEREVEARNRPWTDEELDAMFPDGYEIVEPPASYVPIHTPSRKLLDTPAPMNGAGGFDGSGPAMYEMPTSGDGTVAGAGTGLTLPASMQDLPDLKPEDYQFFGKLLKDVDEEELSVEDLKERRIAKLLLKVKNGTPQQRKSSLRQLTDRARDFGAGPLFNQILPLLMSPTLEDQERHLLVKVIDRILYKLDELVRPYMHKILVVIEPLLIDEDYYARVEGREIISNLINKAADLATMIM